MAYLVKVKVFQKVLRRWWLRKVGKFLKLFNYLKNTQTISNWSVVGFGHFFVAIPILCLSCEKSPGGCRK